MNRPKSTSLNTAYTVTLRFAHIAIATSYMPKRYAEIARGVYLVV